MERSGHEGLPAHGIGRIGPIGPAGPIFHARPATWNSLFPVLAACAAMLAAGVARAQITLKLDSRPVEIPPLADAPRPPAGPVGPLIIIRPANTLRMRLLTMPDADFFGWDAAQLRARAGSTIASPVDLPPKAYEQVLVFADGRRLHGTLLSEKDDEFLWKRPDASEPLHFPRSEVRPATPSATVVPDPGINGNVVIVRRRLNVGQELDNAVGPAGSARTNSLLGSLSAGQVLGGVCFAGPAIAPLVRLPGALLLGRTLQMDVLVFKNGDELTGKALSAALRGPVRWRTAFGQEVTFQPERLAGMRLAGAVKERAPDAAGTAAMIELRSGERLRARLVAFDGQQAHLDHPLLGAVAIDRHRLGCIYPDARLGSADGGRASAGWAWAESHSPEEQEEPPANASTHWSYLDGTYFYRNEATANYVPTSTLPGWQHAIDPQLERFEVAFEMAPTGPTPAYCALTLWGGGGITLCVTITDPMLAVVVMNPRERPGGRWRQIHLNNWQSPSGPRRLQFFVDTNAGTCQIVMNGETVARLGRDEKERLVKTDYHVRIQPLANVRGLLLSQLRVAPWSGEVPRTDGDDRPSFALRNGDVMAAEPKSWRNGAWTLDGELGPMEIPSERVLAVDFGSAASDERAAGRIRLADGSVLDVDEFQWDGRECTARSAIWGNLRLAAAAVSELIFDPAPPPAPRGLAPAPTAEKNPATPDGKLEVRK